MIQQDDKQRKKSGHLSSCHIISCSRFRNSTTDHTKKFTYAPHLSISWQSNKISANICAQLPVVTGYSCAILDKVSLANRRHHVSLWMIKKNRVCMSQNDVERTANRMVEHHSVTYISSMAKGTNKQCHAITSAWQSKGIKIESMGYKTLNKCYSEPFPLLCLCHVGFFHTVLCCWRLMVTIFGYSPLPKYVQLVASH